jgi:hypothetical protein
MEDTMQIIAGTRPKGSCAPDGHTRWATRTFDDGVWRFVTYNGWLIENETSTTDLALVDDITAAIVNRVGEAL